MDQVLGSTPQEYKDLGNQYDSVVGLGGFDGTSWHNIGSGTVIGPRSVIGAAHSALGNNEQLYEQYAIITGTHLVDDAWAMYYTTEVVVHPEFTDIIVSPDMAVWTFDEVIENVTPADLYRGSDPAQLGSLVTLAGFGMYGYPSTGYIELDGAKRGCQNLLSDIGWPTSGAGDDQLLMKFARPGFSAYQHLGGVGGPGDSGGGWFIGNDDQLFGIHGYVIGTYEYGYAGSTSVSQHADWIDAQIVPEPGTLVMLIAGGVLCFLARRKR